MRAGGFNCDFSDKMRIDGHEMLMVRLSKGLWRVILPSILSYRIMVTYTTLYTVCLSVCLMSVLMSYPITNTYQIRYIAAPGRADAAHRRGAAPGGADAVRNPYSRIWRPLAAALVCGCDPGLSLEVSRVMGAHMWALTH